MSTTAKKVLMHILAVAVPLAVTLLLVWLFGIESPYVKGAMALVMVGLEKWVRASDTSPVPDYVNSNS